MQVDATYLTANEYHNPMEPHASTVLYKADGTLEIHDKTQGTQNCQDYLHKVFGLPKASIRVRAAFVGGAFGSGLRPQYQLPLAVMAALHLQRSVRVTLTRQQMFTFGYRPRTEQRLRLGADVNGQLLAIAHDALGQTSRFEDFTEHVVEWSGMLYQCDNVALSYRLASLDVYTPLDMRAPGAASGMIALECAMDELACAAQIDPLELRRRNFTANNANEGKPYSSKELLACYRQGAERFGWQNRNPQPRSMRHGNQLIGWGMAGGVWEAMQMKASAKARFDAQGHLTVCSATTDIGTGTYTVMTQIAADAAGARVQDVTFVLGDSSLPTAPLQADRLRCRRSVRPCARPARYCAPKCWNMRAGCTPKWPARPGSRSFSPMATCTRAAIAWPCRTSSPAPLTVSSKCKSTPSPAPDANRSPPLPIRQYSWKSTSTRTLAQSRLHG